METVTSLYSLVTAYENSSHSVTIKIQIVFCVLGESLSCKFHFLLELGILTVETELNVKAGGNVDPNNVLADLYQVGF